MNFENMEKINFRKYEIYKNCLYIIYKIYINYLNLPIIYDEAIVNLIKKLIMYLLYSNIKNLMKIQKKNKNFI